MPPPTARRSRRRLPVAVLAAALGAVTLGAPPRVGVEHRRRGGLSRRARHLRCHGRGRRDRDDGLLQLRPEDVGHPSAAEVARLRRRRPVERQARGVRQRRPRDDLPVRPAGGHRPTEGALRRPVRRGERPAVGHPHPLGARRLLPPRRLQPLRPRLPEGDLPSRRRRHNGLRHEGPRRPEARHDGPGHGDPHRRQRQPLPGGIRPQSGLRPGGLPERDRPGDDRAALQAGRQGRGRDCSVRHPQHLDHQQEHAHQPRQQGLRRLRLGARPRRRALPRRHPRVRRGLPQHQRATTCRRTST